MQSRLRISAPFYLIFTKCHFATPTARIYIILFNFQVGNNFDDKKNPRLRIFFILSCAGAAVWIGRLDITAG